MTYPGLIFWALAALCLLSRGPLLYRLFFVSWSFGMLAMIPPQIVGASIFPAWILAVILTIRTVMEVGPRTYLGAVFDFRRFGMLTACTLYAVVSAVILPRLFAGQIDVINMRPGSEAAGLAPSVSNFIQGAYFVLTTLTVVNIYFAAREPERRKALLDAFAWGAAAAIVTGLADMVTVAAGKGSLLTPYRNAGYMLLLDNEVGDMKRVIGLMSEASAYGALCVGFLAPLAMTPEGRASAPWGRWRLPLAAGLVAMTYLSTSSGGYVALAAVGLVALIATGLGLLGGRKPAWIVAYWLLILAVVALGIAIFEPQTFDGLGRMIDLVVMRKSQSSSYVERSAWNRVAMDVFVQSGGLGGGIGCCRTSSWIFAVLSNIGAPGAVLLVVFMAQVFLARAADPQDTGLLRLVKLSILPALFVISLTSPAVGFGLAAAWLFGFGMALARPAAAASAVAPAAAAGAALPTPLIRLGYGFAQLAGARRRRS